MRCDARGEHDTVPAPLCSFHWHREASSAVVLSLVLWHANSLNAVAFVCALFRPIARGPHIFDLALLRAV